MAVGGGYSGKTGYSGYSVPGKSKSSPASGYTPAPNVSLKSGQVAAVTPSGKVIAVTPQTSRGTVVSQPSVTRGAYEPNVSLATGGAGMGVGNQLVARQQAQRVQTLQASAQSQGTGQIVERTLSPDDPRSTARDYGEGGRVLSERPIVVKQVFYKTSKGDLFALPASAGGAKKSLVESRLQAAEAKGPLSSSTVQQIGVASGIGYGGGDLFKEEKMEDIQEGSSIEYITSVLGPTSFSGTQVTPTKELTKPTNYAALTGKEIEAKQFYESQNPIGKTGLVLKTILSSPKGFEIAGSALLNQESKEKLFYGELAKQKREYEQNKENQIVYAFKKTGESITNPETPAGTAAYGAALSYGFSAAGTAAFPILTEAPVVGPALKGAAELFAKNPRAVTTATAVIDVGIVGASSYFSGEDAVRQGKSIEEIKTAQASGALKGVAFVSGAKVGQKLYDLQPSPLEGATIRVPTGEGTSERLYTGLTYTTRSGRSIPILGKAERGGIVIGKFPSPSQTPSLSKFAASEQTIVMESPAQTSYFTQKKVLSALGASTAETEKTAIVPVTRAVQNTKSIYNTGLPKETQTAGTDVTLAIKTLKQSGTKYELYGSYAAQSQSPTQYRQFIPADLDVRLQTTSAKQAESVAQQLVKNLNAKGSGQFKYQISSEKSTLVESVRKGETTGRHAFDIHFKGETPDPSLGPVSQSGRLLGIKIDQPAIRMNGVPTQRLSEQAVRKAGATLTIRSKAGKVVLEPELHRAKDIADTFSSTRSLILSKQARGENVAELEKGLSQYVKAFRKTGQLTEEVAQGRGLTLRIDEGIGPKQPKFFAASPSSVASRTTGVTFSGSSFASSKIASPRFSTPSSIYKAQYYPSSPSPYKSPYKSPSPYASPKSSSPSSPSPPSPKNYYSGSSYSFSPSTSLYSSPSRYSAYRSTSASAKTPQNYYYSKGYPSGGGSPSSSFTSPKNKTLFASKRVKVRGRYPDLFSISRTQKTTGRLSFGVPKEQTALKSKLYKRSGGLLSPTTELLKNPFKRAPKGLARFV